MNNRRNFLKKSAILSLGALAGKVIGENSLNTMGHFGSFVGELKFELAPLPYTYNALEPFIDAQTMEIHYSKHHQAYTNNLNKALEGTKNTKTIEEILKACSKYDVSIRNNGGGYFNHTLFWSLMKANPEGYKNIPEGKLLDALNSSFGSFENFQKQFAEAAMKRFGSGWAWLIKDTKGKLKISSTPNQDNPLMDNAELKGKPILALDVWEHAYYLKYQNKRADYINNWWNIVNWNKVNELL